MSERIPLNRKFRDEVSADLEHAFRNFGTIVKFVGPGSRCVLQQYKQEPLEFTAAEID